MLVGFDFAELAELLNQRMRCRCKNSLCSCFVYQHAEWELAERMMATTVALRIRAFEIEGCIEKAPRLVQELLPMYLQESGSSDCHTREQLRERVQGLERQAQEQLRSLQAALQALPQVVVEFRLEAAEVDDDKPGKSASGIEREYLLDWARVHSMSVPCSPEKIDRTVGSLGGSGLKASPDTSGFAEALDDEQQRQLEALSAATAGATAACSAGAEGLPGFAAACAGIGAGIGAGIVVWGVGVVGRLASGRLGRAERTGACVRPLAAARCAAR
mmetsp:Transcript_4636/g.14028  ORF Transcript_4636/g.14028 Transcript_4636/m.14028 type:complete len:274 (+) Transcript_4636:156-977(+)